jgi:hypothetical protein
MRLESDTGSAAMKRRRNFTSSDTSFLLQLMGIYSDRGFDPSMAVASWQEVERRLESHPMEASLCSSTSIFYPLKLALMNERTPCPAQVIDKLIRCFPGALSIDDFACACRFKHTTGDVMKTILQYLPQCQERDHVKRWDLDWVAQNKNSDVGLVLVDQCEAANPKCIQHWRNLTHRAFWLSCLLQRKSRVVTEQTIQDRYILQFFITQGNVDCVKLILDAYPMLLGIRCCVNKERMQLPIHFALFADDEGLTYEPWHHRSEIVRLLLKEGCKVKIGGISGCGGLLQNDMDCDGLAYALNAVLNARWNDDEKIKSLQVCLQFAQAYMYDAFVSGVRINEDFPLLHSALGVIQVETIISIMSKIGINTLCVDKEGRTAICALAELIMHHPSPTYIAVQKKASEEKKRAIEYFKKLRSINRDTENQENEQEFLIHRGEDENQMANVVRIQQNLDRDDENHLIPGDFSLPSDDELESKYEYEMITSLFELLLKDELTNSSVTNAATIKDKDRRLAIHFACEKGLSFENGLSRIINSYHQGLLEIDGLTGLFPFGLAATSGNLELTFKVLLEEPSVLALK